MATITGTALSDVLNGTASSDIISGLAGIDTLNGGAGHDVLSGGDGIDRLDGGTGNDTMGGGAGIDTYIVDSTSDVVIEAANAGMDTVQSSVTFTLPANVERLTLTGTAHINATGNDLNNILVGNSGNNILDGAAGADVMEGGLGNDTYIVSVAADVITEAAGQGSDLVQSGITCILPVNVERLTLTGTGNINGTGNTQNNALTGNTGNNVLNGGLGDDIMNGGAGNDTYFVSGAGDVVTEAVGQGIDLVRSSMTYALGANLEHLTLIGAGNISGTGNTQFNTLTGNAGNNLLNGGAGKDTMIGGLGNDFYVVSEAGDVVTEAADGGIDTVQSSIAYVLGAHLENLTLIGEAIGGRGNASGNVLTGNSGNNTLEGLDGNDTLNGGGGSDSLFGGAGDDTYVLDGFIDVVVDTSGIDTIQSSQGRSLHADIENLTLLGTGNINGIGSAANNVLTGNSGDNVLNGLAGNDTLIGGFGNDGFVVDSALDVITEGVGQGTDRVSASVSYVLSGNIENLALDGFNAINGTGNALGNLIQGNGSHNVLDGGAGNDTLIGGQGNDTYVVDSALDVVTEATDPFSGSDSVVSSIDWTLGANLEGLTLAGGYRGTGNDLNNVIQGNSSGNLLEGGFGNDTLNGGGGNDVLMGGVGNDELSGGDGNNVLEGGVGHDTLFGGMHDDQLSGGVGGDRLFGEGGNDNLLGGEDGDLMAGGAGDDLVSGEAGNDELKGDAGSDTLLGGAGNDTLVWDAADALIHGGAGDDTIRVDGPSQTVDLATVPAGRIQDVESINITGNHITGPQSHNTLKLDAAGVLALSSTTNTLLINGNAGDTVESDEAWVFTGTTMINTHTFNVFTFGGATLQIQVGVETGFANIAPTADATTTPFIQENAGASTQNIARNGTVSFNDLDAEDVVDIAFASNGDIAWSGGTIAPGMAATLVAGFTVTPVTNAAAPGSTPWTYSATGVNLDFIGAGQTVTWSYTVTATDPHNATGTDTVTFTINGTNDQPLVGVNAGSTVTEGGLDTITTAELNEADPDDSGAGLTYTVTSVAEHGTLFLDGDLLEVDGTFTQAQIDGGLVTYQHDGSETTSDSFEFSLADGGENGAESVVGEVFTFAIAPDQAFVFGGEGDELSLSGIPGDDIRVVDITGPADADNTLLLEVADVLAASDQVDLLTVIGDAGDSVAYDGGGVWLELGSPVAGFTDYYRNGATLRIADAVDVSTLTDL